MQLPTLTRHSATRHCHQGYTLIELLLYVALLGTLLTTVTYFFGTATSARIKNQSIQEVNDQGVFVMEHLTQTIHNATAVTVPATGSSGSSLTLTVPTAGLSPTVFSGSGTPAAIQIKEGAATAVPLTSNKVQISSLTFKNLSRAGTPGSVQVSFVLSRVNPSNITELEYQKTFTGTAEVAW